MGRVDVGGGVGGGDEEVGEGEEEGVEEESMVMREDVVEELGEVTGCCSRWISIRRSKTPTQSFRLLVRH